MEPVSRRGDRTRFVLAAIAALVGLVWVAQGLGAPIAGSFMIGDPLWILAGLALVLAAGAYAAWPSRRRRADLFAPRGFPHHERISSPTAGPGQVPPRSGDGS